MVVYEGNNWVVADVKFFPWAERCNQIQLSATNSFISLNLFFCLMKYKLSLDCVGAHPLTIVSCPGYIL